MKAILNAFLFSYCISLFAMQTLSSETKPTLFYLFDPLCGWCYGFSPVIVKFCLVHSQNFNVEVISGGMVVGSRVGPIGQVAPYIKGAYKDVENASGVLFGKAFLEGILDKGTAIFTSLPPSKALTVFKSPMPTKQIEYASAIQKAIYFEGKEPDQTDWYADLAQQWGIDKQIFLQKIALPETEEATIKEFRFSAELGVYGFPTVLFLKEGTYYLLAKGAVGYSQLDANYAKTLKNMIR